RDARAQRPAPRARRRLTGRTDGGVAMTDRVDVVVVGSANVDLVLPVERIPRPGEAVLASGLSERPGGKGASQAVAAAGAGAATAFVVSLGDDESGRLLESVLTGAGVDLSLARRTRTPPGTALITVD